MRKAQGEAIDGVTHTLTDMIREWSALREALHLDAAATTPDLIDGLGRRWVWWKGDLYRHEGKAWTRDLMPRPITDSWLCNA